MRMGQVQSSEVITDFYTYSVTFNALAGSSSQTGQIQIEADSDFEIIKTTQVAFISLTPGGTGVTAQQVPLVSVLLTDTGSGRQLMNVALPVVNLFGTGQLPFILPKPKLLYARSILAVTVSNLGDQNYAYLNLAFSGRKIFQV